jgi:DNA-binding NarL/FixJ family response regulator
MDAPDLEGKRRVLLADDHHEVVTALRQFLGFSFEIVGTVSTGHDALDTAVHDRPDVVVLDLKLPDGSGPIGLAHQSGQLSQLAHP